MVTRRSAILGAMLPPLIAGGTASATELPPFSDSAPHIAWTPVPALEGYSPFAPHQRVAALQLSVGYVEDNGARHYFAWSTSEAKAAWVGVRTSYAGSLVRGQGDEVKADYRPKVHIVRNGQERLPVHPGRLPKKIYGVTTATGPVRKAMSPVMKATIERLRPVAGAYDNAPALRTSREDMEWHNFLFPTVMAESGGEFAAINTYDGCHLTFGAFQFAAHAQYFRKFVVALRQRARARCECYLPWAPQLAEGALSSDSEFEQAAQPWLNRDLREVGPEEVDAAARFAIWAAEDLSFIQHLQFEVACDVIRGEIRQRWPALIGRLGAGASLPADVWDCAQMAADICHQGRTSGRDPRLTFDAALERRNTMAALSTFGNNLDQANRARRVLDKIHAQQLQGDRVQALKLILRA